MSLAVAVGTCNVSGQGGSYFSQTHVQLPVDYHGRLTVTDEDGEPIIELELENDEYV